MKRLLILVFGVLFCVSPCRGQVKLDETTETLVRACQDAIKFPSAEEIKKAPATEQGAISFNAAYCMGYFTGVLDLNALFGGLLFCPPKNNLPRNDAIKIFLTYATGQPEFLREPSRSIVASSLADVYPCQR